MSILFLNELWEKIGKEFLLSPINRYCLIRSEFWILGSKNFIHFDSKRIMKEDRGRIFFHNLKRGCLIRNEFWISSSLRTWSILVLHESRESLFFNIYLRMGVVWLRVSFVCGLFDSNTGRLQEFSTYEFSCISLFPFF